jgi:hypothetical protein
VGSFGEVPGEPGVDLVGALCTVYHIAH